MCRLHGNGLVMLEKPKYYEIPLTVRAQQGRDGLRYIKITHRQFFVSLRYTLIFGIHVCRWLLRSA